MAAAVAVAAAVADVIEPCSAEPTLSSRLVDFHPPFQQKPWGLNTGEFLRPARSATFHARFSSALTAMIPVASFLLLAFAYPPRLWLATSSS